MCCRNECRKEYNAIYVNISHNSKQHSDVYFYNDVYFYRYVNVWGRETGTVRKKVPLSP